MTGTQVIGIIGVGEIGCRMGTRLLAAGHQVIAYDISAMAIERAKDRGLDLADSLADLCRRSDLVITCVTDGASLRDVMLGPAGIAANLAAGKILIDTTSAEPWITRELTPLLKEKGLLFLDAPVSGGVPAADAGRINFMVGGDAALLERCRPVLSRLGPVATHVGEIGRGHTLKAINMLALAASMLATGELIAVGCSAGARLGELIAGLDAGIGGSFSTRVHFPRFVAPGNYNSGFTFDLMIKDLSIGIGLAEHSNMPLFLQRSAYDFYRVAANSGLRGQDNTRIVQSLMEGRSVSQARHQPGDLLDRVALAAAGCNILICAESICLGAAVGVAPATVIEVLSASSGDNYPLSRWIARYLNGEDVKGVPTLGKIWNAMSEILSTGMAARVPSPILHRAAAIHTAAITKSDVQADSRSIVTLIAAWTGQSDAIRQGGGV